MTQQILIYGGGGFAREVAWLVESCNREQERYRVAGFIDDNETLHGTILNDIPVISLQAGVRQFPKARVVPGIGSPRVREITMQKAAAAGLQPATIIHPNVEMSRWVDIGEGSVICAGNIVTVNITLGKYVQINLDCTIGHDVIMDDFTTLAPGVHVSGWVHMGKRVYVGTGANIINGTREDPLIIEDDAVIGAGACVTKHVPAATTVVGVPAKPLRKE